MKNPARKDEQGGTQAEEILKESGLLDVLQKYGEVSISKDNTAGAVLGGDVNIHVVRDSRSRKKIPKIFDDIQRSTKFDSYRLANWDSAVLPGGQPGGHYISISKRILDKTWRVNIFLTKPEEEKKRRSHTNISEVLSNLLGRLGRLNISKGLLYVGYALIASLIFFVSLGALNSVFNRELGFGMFSGKSNMPEELNIEEQVVVDDIGEEERVTVIMKEESPAEEEKAAEIPFELPEGAYEGAFEEQLDDFPDIPVELPLPDEETVEEIFPEEEAGPVDASAFIEIFPELPENCEFADNLRIGDINDDVIRLQKVLNFQGEEIYPEGIVSGWFGTLTRAAVIRFQEKYVEDVLVPWGLDRGTGFVGITTRAKINELCGAAGNGS